MTFHSGIPWTESGDEFDDLMPIELDVVPDILSTMFKQQEAHMDAYAEIGGDPRSTLPNLPPHQRGDLDDRLVQAKIREFAGYAVEELYEAINNLKNKPWKQTEKPTDEQAFKEELADAWHFWIEMHIIAGIDPVEVFRQYFMKSLVNQQRQQNGY